MQKMTHGLNLSDLQLLFPIHLSSNLNSNTVFVYWSQLPNPFIAIA